MARTVHTFCRYGLASFGVDVTVEDGRVVKISPDKQNPHSWRDFCAKGRTAHQVVDHPRRLLASMKRVGDRYVETDWDEAIGDIAARLDAIIADGGPDAVAAYYGNPAGYSSSNLMFMNGWLDAIGTHNRYAAHLAAQPPRCARITTLAHVWPRRAKPWTIPTDELHSALRCYHLPPATSRRRQRRRR